jgi:hypothetical protein
MGKPVRTGQPVPVIYGWMHRPYEVNAGNWNISVPVGKEIKRDSVSSGERKRNSPNREACFSGLRALTRSYKGITSGIFWKVEPQTVKVPYANVSALRYCQCTRVARSSWNSVWSWGDHPPRLSTTRQPIVQSNASERWKVPLLGELKVPETIHLQAVGALCLFFGKKMGDRVPFA